MVATLYLLGCVLAPAQAADRPAPAPPAAPAPRAEWVLAPKLARAQELVYRGTFSEESTGTGVQFSRAYRIEARVFVLDTPPRGTEVALLTVLKPREVPAGVSGSAGAARLERAVVDLRGRVVGDPGADLAVPLDGPPTCECGMFVELPGGRVATGQGWEAAEPGRPLRLWQLTGVEMVHGISCLKLAGAQQSDDWDKPRADRTAWRRTDTVWLAPRTGVATRVERVIERREPARRAATQRAVLRYELESSLQYPGPLFEDRRQEIVQATSFRQAALPLVADPARSGPQLTALLAKITYHVDRQPPTPYREAVLQVRRDLEAARRGEAPVRAAAAVAVPPTGAEPGQLAPDFVVPFITHAGPSFQLHRWLGRPIVLVFYQPASTTSAELLRFADQTARAHGREVAVFGLSVDHDPVKVRKQWHELGLSFPVLGGGGLRKSYAVEATPKIVVLDATGVIRGAHLGWGHETPQEVTRDLKGCLKQK